MKHLFNIFTSAILFSGLMIFSRCSEDETTFPITIEDTDACLPPGVKDTTVWVTINKSDIENLFSQNGIAFNINDIKEVKLNTATVTLVSPPSGNLDKVVVFDMWFREVGDNTMGTKVAYLTGITDSSVTVTLESAFSELVGFLELESFEAGLHINQDPYTTDSLCVKGTISLNVTVGGE